MLQLTARVQFSTVVDYQFISHKINYFDQFNYTFTIIYVCLTQCIVKSNMHSVLYSLAISAVYAMFYYNNNRYTDIVVSVVENTIIEQ